MLADIAGWNDNFRLADVVVLNEDDLQQVADIGVIVDHRTDLVDQMDNGLGHPVARGSFASEDRHLSWHLLPLRRCGRFDGQVPVNDSEDVHLLALVLMDALNLHIEKRGGVDGHASRRLDVLGKSDLVGVLDLRPLLLELLVIHKRFESVELIQILQESQTATL